MPRCVEQVQVSRDIFPTAAPIHILVATMDRKTAGTSNRAAVRSQTRYLDLPPNQYSTAIRIRGFVLIFSLRWRIGTCALLLRMGKDFGDDVLPLPSGGFLPTWWYPPRATFTWRDVEVAAFSLLQDVSQHGVPGWTKPSWATVLYVPQTSAMSREWTAGLRSPWDLVGEASVLGNLTHETV